MAIVRVRILRFVYLTDPCVPSARDVHALKSGVISGYALPRRAT